MARLWGFWTIGKLDILRKYLDAFTAAAKSQSELVYLDLFAGQVENRDRLTNEVIEGSARIALSTTNPPFTRLAFFELEPKARLLGETLRKDFPGRTFEIVSGDSNATLASALDKLRWVNWAPTFAFVDPNGPHVAWTTLQQLASFKKPTGGR